MRLFKLFIVSFFLVLSNYISAQNRPPQNVRRVVVTSKYIVENGKRTSKSRAIKQDIKDSLDRIHTIIYRDFETQTIVRHIWHTFSGKQIVGTDEFEDGKLFRFRIFTYNTDSLLAKQDVYMVKPGDTAFYVSLNYTYKDRNPIKIDAFNSKGKRAYKVRSTYDSHGTELIRKVKTYKNYIPVDSIINLTCTPTYDSLGRKVNEQISKTFADGSKFEREYKYEYNKKGLLSAIEEYAPDKRLIQRKTLEYNSKGILKFISIYNSDEVLVDFYALRYELYPTADRIRNRIIEY